MSTSTRSEPIDPNLHDIVLVDQLPEPAWVEGIVVRPCGEVLAARCDSSQLYRIPSTNLTGCESGEETHNESSLLHDFSDVGDTINSFVPITGTGKEEYILVTARADWPNVKFFDTTLWRLTFDSPEEGSEPSITKHMEVPDAIFCFGSVAISDDILVIADTAKCCIWRVDIKAKTSSVLFSGDASLNPKTKMEIFGINRVRVEGGYIWYTNHSTGELWRCKVNEIDGGRDIEVVGVPQLVADGLEHVDGLNMIKGGSVAFTTSFIGGTLFRIDIDAETGKGEVTTLLSSLITPTCTQLVYKEGYEKPFLYFICCGEIPQATLQRNAAAFEAAAIDTNRIKIVVTVTTEITITYEPVGAAA